MERKDTQPKVMQPTGNMDTECKDLPAQSSPYTALNKKELCRQTQNKENFNMLKSGQISRKPDSMLFLGHYDINQF